MIAPERVAVILLAAGASRRFGTQDKLLAPMGGRALVDHAAARLGAMTFGAHIAVCGQQADAVQAVMRGHGFVIASGPASEEGMAGSLGIGIARAQACDVDAVLVCLADMPFVPEAHLRALLAVCDGAPVASVDELGARMPPAVLPRAWFAPVLALNGDAGARSLLADAHLVAAPPGALRDIDRPADMAD